LHKVPCNLLSSSIIVTSISATVIFWSRDRCQIGILNGMEMELLVRQVLSSIYFRAMVKLLLLLNGVCCLKNHLSITFLLTFFKFYYQNCSSSLQISSVGSSPVLKIIRGGIGIFKIRWKIGIRVGLLNFNNSRSFQSIEIFLLTVSIIILVSRLILTLPTIYNSGSRAPSPSCPCLMQKSPPIVAWLLVLVVES